MEGDHSAGLQNLCACLVDHGVKLMNEAHTIKIPFLLQYGLNDQITPPTKLSRFFDSVGSQDKQKIEYDSMRHRPLDDFGRKQFLMDMINWLDRQIVRTDNDLMDLLVTIKGQIG
jgi:alpha-beta hydrolase superfamily lysophospholipase